MPTAYAKTPGRSGREAPDRRSEPICEERWEEEAESKAGQKILVRWAEDRGGSDGGKSCRPAEKRRDLRGRRTRRWGRLRAVVLGRPIRVAVEQYFRLPLIEEIEGG